MSVFYQKFERHAHGEGLKGHATHYCAGCGHGLAHKYLANAIDDLSIQNRTINVSPVGCSVFMYYYMDVGNTQAAHGRAPAVAVGHKVANPDSIVISYQGDGDLAAIGLAEIVSTAQSGIPITVIFINNAIYGMTGGQMAPTTLIGQKSTTTPYGRTHFCGEPIKMAELMAQLDGPIYVERVALFNNRERVRAQKAIAKAVRLQVENKGFSFVEVLSECPTHLHMSGPEAEKWVEENLVPVFPLGVKKDKEAQFPFELKAPSFEPAQVAQVIGGTGEEIPRYTTAFPSHIAADDIALKLAGAGGDGAQTAAMLITHAAINEGFDSTHIPSYGPESRGGTSYADVHIAREEVLSPSAPAPHILVVFNPPSLAKFGPSVQSGGTIVYDSSVIPELPQLRTDIRVYGVPFTETAVEIGKVMVKNIVALGALQAATDIFPKDTFITAIEHSLKDKCAMVPLNKEAFLRGAQAVENLRRR